MSAGEDVRYRPALQAGPIRQVLFKSFPYCGGIPGERNQGINGATNLPLVRTIEVIDQAADVRTRFEHRPLPANRGMGATRSQIPVHALRFCLRSSGQSDFKKLRTVGEIAVAACT